jgi:glycosyltransferase involved in cell wall biosynthesis
MTEQQNPVAVAKTGIVLIGRNEGERLKACIRSITPLNMPTVYVDSGSTDGSREFAQSAGINVVGLDLSIPFTAARARNTGFDELLRQFPQVNAVHFVDGDCTLETGWLKTATDFLSANPRAAVVCGIRKEIHPTASIYNWICDLEWNQPAGETDACGGDALFRVEPFRQAGGFNSTLLAGEEPELCLRLRENRWQIWRLGDIMTRHDAAMTRFSQYWKRAVRSGYGQSRVAFMHRQSSRNIWVRQSIRPLVYALIIPLSLALAFMFGPWGFLLLLVFPLQVLRIAQRRDLMDWKSWAYGSLMMVAKLAETQGTLALLKDIVTGRTRKIIEYK